MVNRQVKTVLASLIRISWCLLLPCAPDPRQMRRELRLVSARPGVPPRADWHRFPDPNGSSRWWSGGCRRRRSSCRV